jgi:purine-binding chemotaxis protein CheW
MSAGASIAKGAGEEIQVVVFQLENEDLAFEINKVREIIKIPDITIIPNSSEYVEGVINLRGQIKTVLNLKKRVGIKEENKGVDGKIIIVEYKDRTFGILVDSVLGVYRLGIENITDSSSIMAGERSDFILGIGRIEERLVLLLEPGTLFSSEEIALT